MAALAYVTAVSLDGSALLLAWAAASCALARAAQRFDDRVAGVGALGFLALITAHVLAFEAPPSALVYGLDSPGRGRPRSRACRGLRRRVRPRRPDAHGERAARPRRRHRRRAALPRLDRDRDAVPARSRASIDTGIGSASASRARRCCRRSGALCGVVALWVGLRANVRIVRLGGLGLLLLATAKVFLYDLSTLGSVYRVASFIALGLLLLTAAFSHQRMRATSLA